MSEPSTVSANTNTTPRSCATVKCDCDTMWSLAQQFSTVRLCTHTGERKGKLVRNYSVRARRIAATYARFYLETEEGGASEKKGRYYWMALGAFASKTVACTFDVWQVRGMTPFDDTVWEGLGKGNFWLFCDISGWHWYRNMFPGSFEKCLRSRNTANYVDQVKAQLKLLPWNIEALPIIKNLAATSEIIAGFDLVSKFEKAPPSARPAIQFQHLLEIADHEQGNILQPLIYKDKSFAARIKLQRSSLVNWAAPPVELVFNHGCSVDVDALKSVAPDGTELEDFESRMAWIVIAARKFHNLMQQKHAYMEKELHIMASWKDAPDTETSGEVIKDRVRRLNNSLNSTFREKR